MTFADVCARVERTSSFSVELPRSQFNRRTGELLSDPTGQTPLYLVRAASGWSAVTRKEEIGVASLEQFDPIGLALQLLAGDTNGFLTPYRDVQLVPAGYRVRVTEDGLEPVSDDLRDYLASNRSVESHWDDDLLTSSAVDSDNSWLFLSGGLDSVSVLLSYAQEGKHLPSIHIDRTGSEHESRFARETAAQAGSNLQSVEYRIHTPEDIFADPKFSPFGRASSYSFYRHALLTAGPRKYVLNGELNGLDVGFTDHSDRFRGLRRRIYKTPFLRSAYLAAGAVAGTLPLCNSTGSKLAVGARSLGTTENWLAFALGAFVGPKGFPGLPPMPFVRDQRSFIRDVTRRISRFSTIGSGSSFEVDFFLLAYRWFLGKSNCAGLQEAAQSVGSQAIFPFNAAKTILRQVSLPPPLQIDKRVLKDHFTDRYPQLSHVINYEKDNSVGNLPGLDYVESSEWAERLDDALSRVPTLAGFNHDLLPAHLAARRGAFQGTRGIPTEAQLNLISLMAARRE